MVCRLFVLFCLVFVLRFHSTNSPSVYRGGARRAGALQAKRVVFQYVLFSSPHFVWNSLPALPYSLYKQRENGVVLSYLFCKIII